jgi:hypothetical protein
VSGTGWFLELRSANGRAVHAIPPDVLPRHGRHGAVSCNLFADHIERQTEIERFWLATLDLPVDRLGKTMVNIHSKHSKRLRKNVLPYGTVKIVVSRVAIIQAIYGALQELGGFERREWVEM